MRLYLICFHQLNVQARDNGFPPQNSSDEGRVTIRVKRNHQGPSFTIVMYEAAVPETAEIGEHILEVSAADEDADVGLSLSDHSREAFDTPFWPWAHYFGGDGTNPPTFCHFDLYYWYIQFSGFPQTN